MKKVTNETAEKLADSPFLLIMKAKDSIFILKSVEFLGDEFIWVGLDKFTYWDKKVSTEIEAINMVLTDDRCELFTMAKPFDEYIKNVIDTVFHNC